MTNRAANDLRDALPAGYTVLSLDLLPDPDFQVAFLYKPAESFQIQEPLALALMPEGTRPMAVLDHLRDGHRTRIFACHWPARFEEKSSDWRGDLAHHLNMDIYDFLRGQSEGDTRHVLVLGDLNEEPWGGPLENRMYATRDRAASRRPAHHTDHPIKRVRLYNCSWRLVGERSPHIGGVAGGDTAGTLYWEAKKTWHTFDHVIVDGSLLGQAEPFLDESSVRVLTSPLLLGDAGAPLPFDWNNGDPVGVSDHLPLSGRIVFKRGDNHA